MLRSNFTKAVLVILSVSCTAYADEDPKDGQKPRRVPTEERGPGPQVPPPRDDRSMGPGVVDERGPRPQPPREEPNPYRPEPPRHEPPRYEPPRHDDPPFRPPQPPRYEPPVYRPEPPRPPSRPRPPYRPQPPTYRPEPPIYRPEPPVYQPPYTPPSQGYWQYETQTIYVGRAVANERFYLREAAGLDGAYRGWQIISVRAVTRSNSPRTTTVKLVADGRTLVTQVNPRNQINLVPASRAVLDSNVNTLEMVILGSTIIVDNIEIQLGVYRR